MIDDSGKYIRLFGMLFLTMLGFLISLILLFLGIKLIFGLVNQLPWISYVYTLFILSVPAAIFITAFTVYFSRTRSHPSRPVRTFSYLLFLVFLCAWVVFYIMDMVTFFKTAQTQVVDYKSWNKIFLTANVACLFFVGVVQALNSAKEKDWMERNKKGPTEY